MALDREKHYDVINAEIGHRDHLDDSTLVSNFIKFKRMLESLSPMTAVLLTIGGYDDDPREICQIVEARRYVIKFSYLMMTNGIPSSRFVIDSIEFMRNCVAAEKGIEVRLRKPDLDKTISSIEEYREHVRESMN